MVPSEHSSGANTQRAGITKTGNGRVRRILVEAAWNNVRTKHPGYRVRQRRKEGPIWAAAIARRAEDRLYRRYWMLTHRGKEKTTAATAVARELVGFVWDIMMQQTHHDLEADTSAP